MAKVLKTLRNNWKKSIFFTGLGIYGGNWAKLKWTENNLMRQYSLEALSYGQQTIKSASVKPYHVTVFLNPAASGGKARAKFEKYCSPLLHLSGIKVSVLRTEGQGQAKTMMEIVEDTDAVLIAGGDGTLMEAVTGLLRRKDADQIVKELPLGVLPVGKNNKMARNLFPGMVDDLGEAGLMAEAAMSVVRQLFRPVSVIEVKNLSETLEGKSLYGLRQVQVGAFNDAHERMDKYWYWPGLKKYMTYVFSYTTSASKVMWNLPSQISSGQYVETKPSEEEIPVSRSWWSYIFGRSSRSKNEAPKTHLEFDQGIHYNGCEINIESVNNSPLSKDQDQKLLKISLGPDELSFSDYVQEGWHREQSVEQKVPTEWFKQEAPAILWHPDSSLDSEEDINERFFYLDNESVDIKGPLEISLIPDKVVLFCSETARKDLKAEKSEQKWWQRNVSKLPMTVTPAAATAVR
jgi:acylglycerol kinase